MSRIFIFIFLLLPFSYDLCAQDTTYYKEAPLVGWQEQDEIAPKTKKGNIEPSNDDLYPYKMGFQIGLQPFGLNDLGVSRGVYTGNLTQLGLNGTFDMDGYFISGLFQVDWGTVESCLVPISYNIDGTNDFQTTVDGLASNELRTSHVELRFMAGMNAAQTSQLTFRLNGGFNTGFRSLDYPSLGFLINSDKYSYLSKHRESVISLVFQPELIVKLHANHTLEFAPSFPLMSYYGRSITVNDESNTKSTTGTVSLVEYNKLLTPAHYYWLDLPITYRFQFSHKLSTEFKCWARTYHATYPEQVVMGYLQFSLGLNLHFGE